METTLPQNPTISLGRICSKKLMNIPIRKDISYSKDILSDIKRLSVTNAQKELPLAATHTIGALQYRKIRFFTQANKIYLRTIKLVLFSQLISGAYCFWLFRPLTRLFPWHCASLTGATENLICAQLTYGWDRLRCHNLSRSL